MNPILPHRSPEYEGTGTESLPCKDTALLENTSVVQTFATKDNLEAGKAPGFALKGLALAGRLPSRRKCTYQTAALESE